MLTQSRLKEFLDYDPLTGIFAWKKRTHLNSTEIVIGGIAGSTNNGGYRQICINQKSYKAHRLAWLFIYGVWPEFQIDHIDQNKSNNRITNLRDVSISENCQNRKSGKSNKNGFDGVTQTKTGFAARMTLGSFKTAEEAHMCYINAKRKLCAHAP